MEYFWIGTIFQPSILIVNQWLTQKQSQKRIYRCLARSNNGDINSKWKKRLLGTILSGFGTYYTSSPTCSCDNRKRYSTDVITWPNLQRIRRNNDLWNRLPLKFTPLYRLLKVWPAIDRTRVHTSASRHKSSSFFTKPKISRKQSSFSRNKEFDGWSSCALLDWWSAALWSKPLADWFIWSGH